MHSCFPRWYAQSKLNPKTWASPCDLGNEQIFLSLLHSIVEDQNRLLQQNSTSEFYALSAAVIEDILELQKIETNPATKCSLLYLQFETSIAPVNVAINNGEANITFDWIHNGLSDCVSSQTQREFFTSRLVDFFVTPIAWITITRQASFQDWFGKLYYYSASWAALYQISNDLMPLALAVISTPWADTRQALHTILFMLDWSTKNNHPAEKKLAGIALSAFKDPGLPISLKARIAVSFTTPAARLTPMTPEDWATWALSNCSGNLHPQDVLQFLIVKSTTSENWDHVRDELLNSTEAYVADLQRSIHSQTALMISIDQRVKILDCLFYRLHAYERSQDLLAVVSRWYAVAVEARRTTHVLWVLPNHSDGMAYLGEYSYLFPHNGFNAIENTNEETNKALGITLTLQGQKTINPVQARPGTPEYGYGPQLEQTLRNHYQWASVAKTEFEWARAMAIRPGYPHPVQALMQAETGFCLPITSSLHEPLADRAIHKAAIWFSGEDNYSEMEADAIAAIFEAVGITCIRLCGHQQTKHDFLNLYADASLDLLWVAGHGECDRWTPSSPAILVGGGAQVFMDDLLALPISGAGRRLLVLNICDSGAASVLGGIHKLGLAPMLASAHQSVVGHSWPIDPLIAAGFGVKLAQELISDPARFFAAYERALASLREPWEAFVEQITGRLDAEIVQRLRNNERDLGNIFHWGSPCFFE